MSDLVLVFDLDDTLYPLRRFVVSGFARVSCHLADTWGVDAREAFAVLTRALRQTRGFELQAVVDHFALPPRIVPGLVEIIRGHEPRLRLPGVTARVLDQLRRTWLLAVVTNGQPDQQARKVRALGLGGLVDAVIYAHAGSGAGKPDRAPFLEALGRLGVPAERAVFVGDDPVADIAGAARAGLSTIRVMPRIAGGRTAAGAADAVVGSLSDVPATAEGLVERRWRSYVV